MTIFEILKNLGKQKVDMYVDMDGVVADYDVGVPAKYDEKRPLVSVLSKLEEISKMPNVKLNILSVTRMSEGIEQKNKWLDKFAPFFKKENRNILSREKYNFEKKAIDLKYEFITGLEQKDTKIIFIDDDPSILRKIDENCEGILLLKETTFID